MENTAGRHLIAYLYPSHVAMIDFGKHRKTAICHLNLLRMGILVLGVFACFSASSQDEPQLEIQLISDGQILNVSDGDTVTLHGHPVVVRTEKTKTFELKGFSFQYPRDFAYHHERSDGLETWTFDGNNFVIMLFEFPGKAELGSFTREMTRKFGKKNCLVEDRTLDLSGNRLKGQRINVSLLGSKLTFDLYPVKIEPRKTHVIAFQDTKQDDGSDSSEGIDTMALLVSSLQLP